jgi:hypothetical protein
VLPHGGQLWPSGDCVGSGTGGNRCDRAGNTARRRTRAAERRRQRRAAAYWHGSRKTHARSRRAGRPQYIDILTAVSDSVRARWPYELSTALKNYHASEGTAFTTAVWSAMYSEPCGRDHATHSTYRPPPPPTVSRARESVARGSCGVAGKGGRRGGLAGAAPTLERIPSTRLGARPTAPSARSPGPSCPVECPPPKIADNEEPRVRPDHEREEAR